MNASAMYAAPMPNGRITVLDQNERSQATTKIPGQTVVPARHPPVPRRRMPEANADPVTDHLLTSNDRITALDQNERSHATTKIPGQTAVPARPPPVPRRRMPEANVDPVTDHPLTSNDRITALDQNERGQAATKSPGQTVVPARHPPVPRRRMPEVNADPVTDHLLTSNGRITALDQNERGQAATKIPGQTVVPARPPPVPRHRMPEANADPVTDHLISRRE